MYCSVHVFERANRREVRNSDGGALLEAQGGVESTRTRLVHHCALRKRTRSALSEKHAVADLRS